MLYVCRKIRLYFPFREHSMIAACCLVTSNAASWLSPAWESARQMTLRCNQRLTLHPVSSVKIEDSKP